MAMPTNTNKPEMVKTARPLGVGMHSFGEHWKLANSRSGSAKFRDAPGFVDYCRRLGASGTQVYLGILDSKTTRQLRVDVEKSGRFLEAQAALPPDEQQSEKFEAELRTASEAGATILRVALLGGRRYETFETFESYRSFQSRARKSLELGEKMAKRRGIRIAVENHKDFLAGEQLEMIKSFGSESIGICLDTGNNLALLENPLTVVQQLAPLTISVHLKDMAMASSSDGFHLSEIPFGQGFLDLKTMVQIITEANPRIQFSLEMITRDPLKIPCLKPGYWETFPDRPAQVLAEALQLLRKHASAKALPMTTGLSEEQRLELEEENVRICLAEGRARLGLV